MKAIKLYTLVLGAFLFCTTLTFAQVDRTKAPESGPAPKIQLKTPKEFTLDNGLTVMVVENTKLPRVSYQLRIDNVPTLDGNKSGITGILGAMLGNGTTNIPKEAFNEEIDFMGANLNFGSSGGFASGLSKYSERILELMADAVKNPLFVEDEFNKEKDRAIQGFKTDEKNVEAIASRVSDALVYGTNHPYGEFTTEETLNNITFADIEPLYRAQFSPSNAYLVIVGDVTFNDVKKQVSKYLGSWKGTETVKREMPKVAPNPSKTQIEFVDMPNAVQSNIIVANNVDLKMGDKDYFPALIANYILGGEATGYLFKNLRDDKGYTYGSYSGIGASKYGASDFSATAEVRNEVTDSSVVEMLKEIKRIGAEKVDPEVLETAKAAYGGSFIKALERPQTIANFALNTKLNKLPKDFYKNYLTSLNTVTADDVMRVANKYFMADNARVFVVGKGADVLENLEKTGLPINYYDKYAAPAEKPVAETLPEGVDAKSILNKYLEATGIKDNLSKITSIITQYEATTPMGAIVQEEKRIDGKTSQSRFVGGNKMVTIIMTQEGASANNQPLPESMTNDMKPNAGLFMELNLLKSDNVKFSGIEQVDGKDAYVIEVPGEIITWTMFYDVESGLKVKEIQTSNMQGRSQKQDALLKDYNDYSGIKFPETRAANMMGQAIEFKLKEVKINEGVSEADFGN